MTREKILEADDLETELVPVPEWGGDVLIRSLDGVGRDTFEMAVYRMRQNPREEVNIRARLVALCAVDDAGLQLFSEKDVARLGAKSARALDRCFTVAQRLNGLTAADVSELAKN